MTRLGDENVLLAGVGALCEGPCWDDRTGRLHWVDILAGRVHAADPATGDHESWNLGMPVGAIAPRGSGGWVAAVERGFALFDERWSMVGTVVPAPRQPPGTRFNDGRCDLAGRFWAGTLAYDGAADVASLYRFDAADTVCEMLTGVTISNGLDWSGNGRTMYYVDTGRGTVDRLDFDPASGTPCNRTTLVTIPPADGAPDGLIVDADDHLWIALWDGGCVRRYTPDGALERQVDLPTTRVTSMAFGGQMLDELFITTASAGLTPAQLASQPLAGSVFRHRPGITGRPAPRFAS